MHAVAIIGVLVKLVNPLEQESGWFFLALEVYELLEEYITLLLVEVV